MLPELVELILSFLPPSHKLLQLSHVCRAFPALCPSSFSEDRLSVTDAVIKAVGRDPNLLSRVRQIDVSARQAWEGRGPGPPALPPAIFAFVGARVVDVHVSMWATEVVDLSSVLRSLRPLPLLHKLVLRADKDKYGPGGQWERQRVVRASSLQLLRQLPALSDLTLSGLALPLGSMEFLCSLLLERLSLEAAEIVGDDGAHRPAVTALAAPATRSLRALSLPAGLGRAPDAKAEALRVLRAYGEDRAHAPVQLAYVDCMAVDKDDELQRALFFIPSLSQLSLVVTSTELAETLWRSSHTRSLPALQHLQLRFAGTSALRRDVVRQDDLSGTAEPREWLAEVAPACIAFLASYVAQLHTVDIGPLPKADVGEALAQAALRCCAVRTLLLSGVYRESNNTEHRFDHNLDCSRLRFTPLPHLHTLRLSHLDLSHAQLQALLQACPALQDAELVALPAFSLDLLPAIGRSCRHLRQLTAKDCAKDVFSRPVQPLAAHAGGHSDALFPHLLSLSVDISGICGCCGVAAPAQSTVQWLADLLRPSSAPAFAFLYVEFDHKGCDLSPFAALTGLRGFYLRRGWSDDHRRSCFEHHSGGWGESHKELYWLEQSSNAAHEADVRRQLADHFRPRGCLFHQQADIGREAFFAAPAERPQEEVDMAWDDNDEEGDEGEDDHDGADDGETPDENDDGEREGGDEQMGDDEG